MDTYKRPLKAKATGKLSRPSTKKVMGTRSNEMKEVDAKTASLVVEIMNARTSFHKLHLQVTGDGSFAQHKALNELYDSLPDLVDTIAEGYQGACEVILMYPDKAPATLTNVDGALDYMRMLTSQIDELQYCMPHSEVVSNLDLIKDEINSAKYKLLFLS
tara:strand:+ start:2105 stop:2584 length:480 start_codon:yes stop_codon:yes gene_type:complete